MTKPIRRSNAPTPEKYAMSGSEDAEQIALCMWAAQEETRLLFPELKWLFAVPNGGFRHKSEAAKFKAMGVKSGVPDICLPVKRGEYSGLFIELKRRAKDGKRAGRTSADQDVWIDYLKTQGFGACICKGWDEAREAVISYLTYGKK